MNRADSSILEAALRTTRHLVAERCLEALCKESLALLAGHWSLAFLATDDGHDLAFRASAGKTGLSALESAFEVLDAGLVRHFAPNGPESLSSAIDLLSREGGEEADLPEMGPALLVPLFSSAGRVGLLLVVHRPGGRYAQKEALRAARLAQEIVPALDNLRTVRSLRELVIRDDTADCFNRRYLDQILEDETERSRRFGGKYSLIFLDMDNLKEVNTHHGHSAGSRVLYEASVRISRTVRSIDRLFRYGGDEFVILLPGTSLEGAREVAERIRVDLSKTPFELPSGARVALSASTGVSAWPEHGPSGRKVVECADEAMRQVKARGKNAVAVAPLERDEEGTTRKDDSRG